MLFILGTEVIWWKVKSLIKHQLQNNYWRDVATTLHVLSNSSRWLASKREKHWCLIQPDLCMCGILLSWFQH